MYCFVGISLATQNYINPAIDIIKKKGVLSSESMNATLLAMTNSAAESFIIMNSIFFGVSDIGISTVVQQAAFYSLIIQGKLRFNPAGSFYLIVETSTLIDWWIITRETLFILVYLAIMTFFLQGNNVELWQAFILFLVYIIHIFLMKYSSKYEVAIKKSLANFMEIRELSRLAQQDISVFHRNMRSQALSIEMLNQVNFHIQTFGMHEYIVFGKSGIRRKCKPIMSVKLGEEQFAQKDDSTLMARLNFKRAVTKIILRI